MIKDKLLTMCLTRIRPGILRRMLDSYYETRKTPGDILIYLQEDDVHVPEYVKLLNDTPFMIGPRICLVECCNTIVTKLHPDYGYYQFINDDHIYRTPGWDEILINDIVEKGNGWGIAFGLDKVCDSYWEKYRHPSAEIVSGNIPRTLGYYITPLLHHQQCDAYWREIGEGINRFFRNTNVTIEHRHRWVGAPDDRNYRFVYSPEEIGHGFAGLGEWMKLYRERDINKLKERIAEDEKASGILPLKD